MSHRLPGHGAFFNYDNKMKHEDPTDDIDLHLSDIGGISDIDDLDTSLFDIIPSEEGGDSDGETRYIKPRVRSTTTTDDTGIYNRAVTLARDLRLWNGDRFDALINGEFIFGDFIEAFLTTWNAKATRMTISTLSMNQNNIDSLRNLMEHGYIDRLDLIISAFFYSHEIHGLIPYLYNNLDIDDRLQLAVADVHTKIVIFETAGGKKICIHGSANLRSCGAFEQITIEENPELFDFYDEFHSKIVEKYATIKKNVRTASLWDAVTTKTFREL